METTAVSTLETLELARKIEELEGKTQLYDTGIQVLQHYIHNREERIEMLKKALDNAVATVVRLNEELACVSDRNPSTPAIETGERFFLIQNYLLKNSPTVEILRSSGRLSVTGQTIDELREQGATVTEVMLVPVKIAEGCGKSD